MSERPHHLTTGLPGPAHWLDLGDVVLACDDLGSGDPPLLLVHGFTGSSVDWADVAPALAGRRRVVAFDHRGHGRSTNTGDPASYTFDALAGDLAGVIDRLGLGPVDLLGHSMGGILAQRFVLEHPEGARSLLLMDTAPEPAQRIPASVIGELAAIGRAQGMAAVFDAIRPFLEKPISGDAAAAQEVRLARAEVKLSQVDPEAFAALGHELATYDSMVDRLGAITCPTTVLVGELDAGLRDAADVLAARIPDATLVVIPGAGHSPQEDDPAAWLAAVEAHLDRAERAEP